LFEVRGLEAGTKVAGAALDDLLGTNGLAPADVKGYIYPPLVSQARQYVKEGWVLPAAKLAQLQEGLAKLQAAGSVLEGLKAAKAAEAQRTAVAVERRQAATPPTKRRRTSTSDEQVAGGGGGGGGGSSGGVGEAMGLGLGLDDRFHIGVDDQAADL
jgi:hypothetical protein